jgi:hypothetical protein
MKLEPAEADVLAIDAAAFARAIPDPATRPRFEQLAAAALRGDVPDHLMASLETMLELLFDKGRPSNRAVLQAIFARTPRGRQQSVAAREVNKALRTLRGQRVENLKVTAGPSRHTLLLETDRCKLTLELDSAGARVASLET